MLVEVNKDAGVEWIKAVKCDNSDAISVYKILTGVREEDLPHGDELSKETHREILEDFVNAKKFKVNGEILNRKEFESKFC